MGSGSPKPYQPIDGSPPIEGLNKTPKGNIWRVQATGDRFHEKDERRAIARFYEIVGNRPSVTIEPSDELVNAIRKQEAEGQVRKHSRIIPARLDEQSVWAFIIDKLTNYPEDFATKTGIPVAEVVRLAASLHARAPISLNAFVAIYENQKGVSLQSLRNDISIFRDIKKYLNVTNLNDLTEDRLRKYREYCAQTYDAKFAKSRFRAIKRVIAFGLKKGMDDREISAALIRLNVLKAKSTATTKVAKPIAYEDWKRLLHAAENSPWRAWLLVGLNCVLRLEQVCNLHWTEINLDSGLFCRRDGKLCAAVLWPETISELRMLRSGSHYVFLSKHGDQYKPASRKNDFRKFAASAHLSRISFDQLHDGAYAAACKSCDHKAAELLAGLSSESPYRDDASFIDMVRPAITAVYATYMAPS